MKENVNFKNFQEKTEKTLSKWQDKQKSKTKILKKLYILAERKSISYSRVERMKNCGNFFDFHVCNECGHMTVTRANLCRDKLCPICGWRLSLKRTKEMLQIFQKVELNKYLPCFLTLTVKNCEPKNLRKTIKEMGEAWHKLIRQRFYEKNLKGWARNLEITYNEKTNTFHPHFHIILLWDKNINLKNIHEKIAENWQKTLNLDYKPIICHDLIKSKNNEENKINKIEKAIVETAKYSLKSSEINTLDIETLDILQKAIKGKRTIGFGGILNQIKKELNLTFEMEENEDNKAINFCSLCKNKEVIYATAKWAFKAEIYEILRRETHEE